MKKVLDTYSSKNDINIKQIVAYKDNILEIEEYKDGFKKEDTMNVMSVTKSVTSLLIGIAIDQGLIKSVDDYVMDYYKDTYTPKRGEQTIFKVTIKHLLTMTAPYKDVRGDNYDILDGLNLIDGELLKRVALLLFHHNPEKWIPGSFVKIGYFKVILS